MIWTSRTKKSQPTGDNRLTALGAIIFLFAAAIIIRLFNVQIINYDLYAAKALRQHGVEEEIVPERGRIFVRAAQENSGLYPLAANKEFALVYAVPAKITNPKDAMEKLAPVLFPLTYEEPNVELMVANIEKDLRAAMAKEIIKNNPPAPGQEIAINEEELKIALTKERLIVEDKIKKEKEEKLKLYQEELLAKLSKQGDPYEPLAKKVDKDKLEEIMALKMAGIDYWLSDFRYYPEKNISSHILGYVLENNENTITQGSYGLEGFFNKELSGVMGKLIAERDASGQIIAAVDSELNPAVNGSDFILTVDKAVQDFACRKLNESALRHGADSGALIIMNPKTGAIIAMCAWPDFDPNDYGETKNLNFFNNIGVWQAYEVGSVFKPLTMSMGIDLGLVEPDSKFVDTGSVVIATETIKNAEDKTYGEVTMSGILENSINTGAVYVARQVGVNNFLKYAENYGFGQKAGITLMTESEGNFSSLSDKMHGDNLNLATASFGQGTMATPLQLASAFSVIANGGVLTKPFIVDEIVSPDGKHLKSEPQAVRRVISPRTAALISGMMVNVAELGHAKRARVPGYYVAAKTGTAQIASRTGRGYAGRTNHTLVGFAPASDPAFVMVTYLEDPKDAKYAESTATPLFGEVANFVLNYYQVKKER
jgi:cell division protein FtsI/penicillin-binding protein 2